MKTNPLDIKLPEGRWVFLGRGKFGRMNDCEEYLVQLYFVNASFFVRERRFDCAPLAGEVATILVTSSQLLLLHCGTILDSNGKSCSVVETNVARVNKNMRRIAKNPGQRKSIFFQAVRITVREPSALALNTIGFFVGDGIRNTVFRDLFDMPCFCIKGQFDERTITFLIPSSEVVRHFFLMGTELAKKIFSGMHMECFDDEVFIGDDMQNGGKRLIMNIEHGFTNKEIKVLAEIATIPEAYAAAKNINAGLMLRAQKGEVLERGVLDCGYIETIFPAGIDLEIAISGYFIDSKSHNLFVVNQIHKSSNVAPFDSIYWIPIVDTRQWKNKTEREKLEKKKGKKRVMSRNEPPSDDISVTSDKSNNGDSERRVYFIEEENVAIFDEIEDAVIPVKKAEKTSQAFQYTGGVKRYNRADDKISIGNNGGGNGKGSSNGEIKVREEGDFNYIKAVCVSLLRELFNVSYYIYSYDFKGWCSDSEIKEICLRGKHFVLLRIERNGCCFYICELLEGTKAHFHMTALFYDPSFAELDESMVRYLIKKVSKSGAKWGDVKKNSISRLELNRFNHKKKTVTSVKTSEKNVDSVNETQKVDSVEKVGVFINWLIEKSQSQVIGS